MSIVPRGLVYGNIHLQHLTANIILDDMTLHDKETEERKHSSYLIYAHVYSQPIEQKQSFISVTILVPVPGHMTLVDVGNYLPLPAVLCFLHPQQTFQ